MAVTPAVVVLQLVGEGTVGLDAPIEQYLPGLVRGNGYDGARITVRQLLQHTSGMADYINDVLADPDANNHPWRPGFDSFTAATHDGRSAFAVANGHLTNGSTADVRGAVELALC